jgi:hypothetical protein
MSEENVLGIERGMDGKTRINHNKQKGLLYHSNGGIF